MIGIFGGTFDPVHFGHLRVALDFAEQLTLEQVRLLPCRQPPHRQLPLASADDRLTMLELAVTDNSVLSIDTRELQRDGPSYMVDTLMSLRNEMPHTPLVLLLGMDSFAHFDQWHQWQHIIELAHIAVAGRPGAPVSLERSVETWCRQYRIADDQCLAGVAGQIIFCPVTQMDISATEIRARFRQGRSPRYLLPDAVISFIEEKNLYHD